MKGTAIALIPARSGSKRVPDKNVRQLDGHPLLAYTIASALGSGIFSSVFVSTDSGKYAEIARYYGAEVPFLRPPEFSGDLSPDFEWIEFTLMELKKLGQNYDFFSILRPTSPFRLPETIRRAWNEVNKAGQVDSIRAVEKCKQHPGKMWVVHGNRLLPILPFTREGQPWHSSQTQGLPEILVQNASLEIARTSVIIEHKNISGSTICPFFTEGFEGLDINRPEDFEMAIKLVESGSARLPAISRRPF